MVLVVDTSMGIQLDRCRTHTRSYSQGCRRPDVAVYEMAQMVSTEYEVKCLLFSCHDAGKDSSQKHFNFHNQININEKF